MDHTTFLWTIAATVLAGLQFFVNKIAAEKKLNSGLNGFFGYGLSVFGAAGLLFFYEGMPADWVFIALLAGLSGIVHGSGSYFRTEALKVIDAVIYFPLNKVLGPILVAVAGVSLLGENLTGTQQWGVLLSVLVPLLLVSKVEQQRQKNLHRGIGFMVLSTVLTAVSIVMTKHTLSVGSQIFFFMFFSQAAAMGTSFIVFYFSTVRKNVASLVSHISREDVVIGGLSALFQFTSFTALLMALTQGNVSLVYTIQAHYILIPIFLSVWWYKEHLDLRKFIAVVVSCLAIGLLY
jgi:drug/metabolite transporter (DMT)-like permease